MGEPSRAGVRVLLYHDHVPKIPSEPESPTYLSPLVSLGPNKFYDPICLLSESVTPSFPSPGPCCLLSTPQLIHNRYPWTTVRPWIPTRRRSNGCWWFNERSGDGSVTVSFGVREKVISSLFAKK